MKILNLLLLVLFLSCGRLESLDLATDADLDRIDRELDKQKERIKSLENNLYYLSQSIDDMSVNQDMLESQVLSNISNILILQQNTTIKELIDPSGSNPNQYDEILIVLSDDSIIGYFEQGNKRFLTALTDGNYRTTDKQACNFSIVDGKYQE